MQTTLARANENNRDLLLEFMEEYYRFDHLPFDRKKATAALSQLLKNDALGSVWLVQAGPTTAGYVVLTLGFSLEYHGRDAFIDEIYLREAFRGQGCGRAAMVLVAEEARRLGVQALHLEVERENRAAQAFYREVGFGDHGRFLMTKRLDDKTA